MLLHCCFLGGRVAQTGAMFELIPRRPFKGMWDSSFHFISASLSSVWENAGLRGLETRPTCSWLATSARPLFIGFLSHPLAANSAVSGQLTS